MTSEEIVKKDYPYAVIVDKRLQGLGFILRLHADSIHDFAIGKTELEAWMRAKAKIRKQEFQNEKMIS